MFIVVFYILFPINVLMHTSMQFKTNAKFAQTTFYSDPIMPMPIKTSVQQNAKDLITILIFVWIVSKIWEVWNPLSLLCSYMMLNLTFMSLFLLFFIMSMWDTLNTRIKTMLKSTRVLIVPIWVLLCVRVCIVLLGFLAGLWSLRSPRRRLKSEAMEQVVFYPCQNNTCKSAQLQSAESSCIWCSKGLCNADISVWWDLLCSVRLHLIEL